MANARKEIAVVTTFSLRELLAITVMLLYVRRYGKIDVLRSIVIGLLLIGAVLSCQRVAGRARR